MSNSEDSTIAKEFGIISAFPGCLLDYLKSKIGPELPYFAQYLTIDSHTEVVLWAKYPSFLHNTGRWVGGPGNAQYLINEEIPGLGTDWADHLDRKECIVRCETIYNYFFPKDNKDLVDPAVDDATISLSSDSHLPGYQTVESHSLDLINHILSDRPSLISKTLRYLMKRIENE